VTVIQSTRGAGRTYAEANGYVYTDITVRRETHTYARYHTLSFHA